MFVFTCENDFHAKLTCIYAAWEQAIKVGHSNIKLQTEPVYMETLFDEYIHIDVDFIKAEKVLETIVRKISYEALHGVHYALLSDCEDALDVVYRFLIKGFKAGAQFYRTYTDPTVSRLQELSRKTGNDVCRFREFVRFQSIDDKVFVSHIEPKCDVLEIVMEHFEDRMPSEYWMIVDDKRKKAAVHPKDEAGYIRYLNETEFEKLRQTEQIKDEFVDMWKAFFAAIAIKERENYTCQRNHFPIWARKHVTEFL